MMAYLLLGMSLFLTGCSTAGPFVTNISNDGRGGLTVEKCMVHFNPLGFVNSSDCNSVNINIATQDKK